MSAVARIAPNGRGRLFVSACPPCRNTIEECVGASPACTNHRKGLHLVRRDAKKFQVLCSCPRQLPLPSPSSPLLLLFLSLFGHRPAVSPPYRNADCLTPSSPYLQSRLPLFRHSFRLSTHTLVILFPYSLFCGSLAQHTRAGHAFPTSLCPLGRGKSPSSPIASNNCKVRFS